MTTKIGEDNCDFLNVAIQSKKSSYIYKFTIPILFNNIDPWPSSLKDGGLNQIIFDKNNNKSINICYNIKGIKGKYIVIAKFKFKQIEIYGEYNEYLYINKLIFKLSNEIFLINSNKLILNNNKEIYWNDDHNKNIINYFSTNLINIFISYKNITIKFKNFFVFHILKSENNYLEIQFNYISTLFSNFYKNIDGIFGNIGKKRFNFKISRKWKYQRNYEKILTIDINGKSHLGIKDMSAADKPCWYLNVNEIIKDKNSFFIDNIEGLSSV